MLVTLRSAYEYIIPKLGPKVTISFRLYSGMKETHMSKERRVCIG